VTGADSLGDTHPARPSDVPFPNYTLHVAERVPHPT
jgi:hypothetical protein